ncbi:hypothetical protein D9615_000180 [Tricholomella constricta]|uniref:HNH nuclease domain-containing protein n=1 Tax=Tricholomella constricta TaxID=117010 RepID=A0A8H5HQL9_9AGAR|nr:hypothetical protein D9615_000180 [Tricholomella constricta]
MLKGSFFRNHRSKGKSPEVQAPLVATQLNNPPASSHNPTRVLLCLIEGDHVVFDIETEANKRARDLKRSIHQKANHRTLSHVNAKDLILLKVDIDVTGYTRSDISGLTVNVGDEGVRELMDWNVVSDFWSEQPSSNMLQVFVKVSDAGEQSGDSKQGFLSEESLIVVVPIEGGELQGHLPIRVHSYEFISRMHHDIRLGLQSYGRIGEFFRSNLDILPLQTMPTLMELQKQNLVDLCVGAYNDPDDLPTSTFAKYFDRFYTRGQKDLRVHCLVWLPTKDKRFPVDILPAVHWFISTSLRALLNFEDATNASRERSETQVTFKALLREEYHQPEDGKLFDMATGRRLPHSTVAASHIYQHKWRKELWRFTTLTDINDPLNGLLLYRPVEWAFDRAKICVQVKSSNQMTFRLLDQSLRDTLLADKACDLRHEAGRGNKRLVDETDLDMTFGDLDGHPLQFPDGVVMRPSRRLLGLHAILAHSAAQDKEPHHRIPEIEYDTSGDKITEMALNNFKIMTWRDNVDPGVISD